MYVSVMKLRNISIISTGIIMLLLPLKASAFIIPKDLPTIEALIALHKAIKKDEDKALTRVATSYGEQSLIEKGAESSMMSDHSGYKAEQCLFVPGTGWCNLFNGQLTVSAGNGIQGLYRQYLQSCIKEAFRSMVLCRCQRGNIKGDTTLLQTICIRSCFGYKPYEGFHG